MSEHQSNDPMHGKTLKAMMTELVDRFGWEELSERISIRCFSNDPSLKSTLNFLRKTPWARTKVENLYRLEVAKVAPAGPHSKEPATELAPKPKKRSVKPRTEPAMPKVNLWTGKPHEEDS